MKKSSFSTSVSTLVAGGLLLSCPAFAVTTLKQVQVSNSSQIDLLFDGKVSKNQVKAEYFNDIIQINLNDVSVYPAKISSISGGNLTKIFAYQYAPRLVRCRITVKGKAENYRDRLQFNAAGKILTVKLTELKAQKADNITLQSAAPVRGQAGAPAEKIETAPSQQAQAGTKDVDSRSESVNEAEEKLLLERVLSRQSLPAVAAPAPAATAAAAPLAHSKSIGSARPLPSFLGILMKLGAVLGIFIVAAMVLRKLAGRSGGSSKDLGGMVEKSGIMGAISKVARNGLGRLGKEKMIEVLSTHYLGPKKNIAVVRICGRVLVLGVSNESINLITELPEDAEELGVHLPDAPAATKAARTQPGSGATAAGPSVFSDFLSAEKTRPAVGSSALAASAYAATQMSGASPSPDPSQPRTGVRAQIRSRLEGLKPL